MPASTAKKLMHSGLGAYEHTIDFLRLQDPCLHAVRLKSPLGRKLIATALNTDNLQNLNGLQSSAYHSST
eukprot:594853-Pleurochrysis_carterae.AAC.6